MGAGKMEISEPISIVRETRPEPVRKNLLSENKESLLFEKNKKNTYTRVSTIYIYIYIYIFFSTNIGFCIDIAHLVDVLSSLCFLLLSLYFFLFSFC